MINKLNIVFLLITVFILILQGCSRETGEGAGNTDFGVYYLTQDEDQILLEPDASITAETEIPDLILALQTDPRDVHLKKTMGSDVLLINYRMEEKGVNLNFEERYNDMPKSKEVLFRAAVVQTVLQNDDINFVTFEVDGEPLKYDNGEEVGGMTVNTFIDNAGDEISSYNKKTVKLYFANSAGTGLKMVERELVYSSNESLEKKVMEQLIAGPSPDEGYATISPDTKINTIVVKNGICYVSLDSSLIDKPIDVSEETLLYSIVNTLADLPGVSKVQISVNGETDRVLRSTMPLDEIYSFNKDIVGSD